MWRVSAMGSGGCCITCATFTSLFCFKEMNGGNPYAGLVQGAGGSFYGTTVSGGAYFNNCGGFSCGTVFKITPDGTLTSFYSFCPGGGGCTDGATPYGGGLVKGTDGNFYGTTEAGGPRPHACGGDYGCGTVFKITPSGTLTTLHSFDVTDGESVYAGLLQGTNGSFYGTTYYGGLYGNCIAACGTVYSISMGLGPFVETNPAAGKVGAAVKILGTDLTGSTSVTFNRTAATFTVKSKSLITTVVPTRATTGTVEVVTPKGTLSSNVPFQVLP